ncbi:unnamed protein product [Psylliodes chrysocephalus]|uniref:FLYWCH-type domain-containing protein n=1 Tax=Psylliodes chrysocephalus TaxID=3402493 RepID=A0A9P0DD94_9CUCU|nr:unnamed protein product [Psylliodes chrysocephala]
MNNSTSTMFSEKGNKLIVLNNFKFSKANTSKCGKIRWKCCNAKCTARVYSHVSNEDVIIEVKAEQNHGVAMNLARNAVSNSVKRKATCDPAEKPAKLIIRELQSNNFAENINSEDINRIRKNMHMRQEEKSCKYSLKTKKRCSILFSNYI